MEPLTIVLIVLAIAGIWAVVELALTLRRTRGTVDALDKTIDQLNDTITEARPVVAKLDGVIDELEPSLSRVEPLLQKANIAVEALSADLIEVNGVIRDVSQLTGGVASASETVTSITDAASKKVQRLFGRKAKMPSAAGERTLKEGGEAPTESASAPDAAASEPEPVQDEPVSKYYTYDSVKEEAAHE